MTTNATFLPALPIVKNMAAQMLALNANAGERCIKIACDNCNMREFCLPIGLNADELGRLGELVTKRPLVKRGTALFRSGDTFTSLYAIRSGFFKTSVGTEDGRTQVVGFQMTGDIIGLDGIASDVYTCDAIALEDSEVCALPFDQIENIARNVKGLQRQVHQIMSREIVREHSVMLLLGGMRAEERLAAFLINLLQRLQTHGFSAHDVVLRMTREEIGSYLGLTLETVSRNFSKFADDGLITVNQRNVHIQDAEALKRIANHEPCR